MEKKTRLKVAVVGSTGLVGGETLKALSQNSEIEEIIALSRRAFDPKLEKVKVTQVDFKKETEIQSALEGINHIFMAIGTTQKKVNGNKELYREIDYGIPLRIAENAPKNLRSYHLVSAIGAKKTASNFYLQLKGEIEEALKNQEGFKLYIYRPSFLLGDRKENRLGEKIGKVLAKSFAFLLPSPYKPVQAKTLAQAMVYNAIHEAEPGVYTYPEIIGQAKRV